MNLLDQNTCERGCVIPDDAEYPDYGLDLYCPLCFKRGELSKVNPEDQE